jgi:hypothetical protein
MRGNSPAFGPSHTGEESKISRVPRVQDPTTPRRTLLDEKGDQHAKSKMDGEREEGKGMNAADKMGDD